MTLYLGAVALLSYRVNDCESMGTYSNTVCQRAFVGATLTDEISLTLTRVFHVCKYLLALKLKSQCHFFRKLFERLSPDVFKNG